MLIRTHSNPEKREALDALIIPFWKTDTTPEPAYAISERLELETRPAIAAGDFSGKEGEVIWIFPKEIEKRVGLLGLGDKPHNTAERMRRCAGSLMRACLDRKVKKFSLFLPHDISTKAFIEGLYFGSYSFDAYKCDSIKDAPTSRVEEIVLITHETHTVQAIADSTHKLMQANFFTRDLVNSSADTVTPQYLAECSSALMNEFGRIKTEVFTKDWIVSQGMGLIHAVSKGSHREPCFIKIHYEGNPSSSDHTVLVGKGITFDTGGLNLKPSGSIENQRQDMGGAAVCLGAIRALAACEVACNVTVLIPSCENAIGPYSYKPGDVYKAYSGKTVEITNTDAEGRLVLADALSYAVQNLKPSRIIDVATLTGACVVALGSQAIGLFSNSDALAEEVAHAGLRTFERTWRFPLFEEYKETLKSDIADIKNAAGREGGAILGALFLQEFIGNTPWLHLDIAGVTMLRERMRYWSKNATGMGVRLLVDYFEHLVKE